MQVDGISPDRTCRVAVAVFICVYALVADRSRRHTVAVAISVLVLAADPTRRTAVSISVGVDRATVLSPGGIPKSIRVNSALGVHWKNQNGQHH